MPFSAAPGVCRTTLAVAGRTRCFSRDRGRDWRRSPDAVAGRSRWPKRGRTCDLCGPVLAPVERVRCAVAPADCGRARASISSGACEVFGTFVVSWNADELEDRPWVAAADAVVIAGPAAATCVPLRFTSACSGSRRVSGVVVASKHCCDAVDCLLRECSCAADDTVTAACANCISPSSSSAIIAAASSSPTPLGGRRSSRFAWPGSPEESKKSCRSCSATKSLTSTSQYERTKAS